MLVRRLTTNACLVRRPSCYARVSGGRVNAITAQVTTLTDTLDTLTAEDVGGNSVDASAMSATLTDVGLTMGDISTTLDDIDIDSFEDDVANESAVIACALSSTECQTCAHTV